MTHYDVFNGDADGLCALQQLRLAAPRDDAILVTGAKRDIALLERVPAAAGDRVTVLDIALTRNRAALARILDAGARVRWFDHHETGVIPAHPGLKFHHEPRPDRGTSLLVDAALGGAWRAWAVVGTFGDNFDAAARAAAAPLDLPEHDIERLRLLGICLNYNGYGASVADLHLPPAELFWRLRPHADPLAFLAADPATFERLRDGHADDLARAETTAPTLDTPTHRLFILPAAPWARRVGGVFANTLARAAPDRAHALLTRLPAGGFLVSARAPLARPTGADALCRAFGGGGRPAAAGIDVLAEEDHDRFVAAFLEAFA